LIVKSGINPLPSLPGITQMIPWKGWFASCWNHMPECRQTFEDIITKLQYGL
jgi:hypothetical protein